jgi:hypothetical protein
MEGQDTKSKYLAYGFLILAVIGAVFISGCVQQEPTELPKPKPTATTAPQPTQPAPDASPPQAPSRSELKFEWTEDSGTRISDGSVPYVHRLKDGRFRLYYCGAGGILSAVSADGLNFEKEPGVRIAPAGGMGYAESMVCDATVIDLPDGKIRMYYKGADGQGGPGQALHKVFSAISSDGLNFQKEGLRIDSEKTGDRGWTSVPEAIKLPDGRVRIYYVSGDFEALGGIMSAVSNDGMNFQKEAGARVKTLADPAVNLLPDGKYLLLAVALPPPRNAPQKSEQPLGIYSFISEDGLTFGNRQTVLQGIGVYDPSIVRLSNDTYRVFYGKDIGGEEGRPNIVTKSITGRLQ